MPIILDHQLREIITHDKTSFPITLFIDELCELPNRSGPFHWHPDFEIATCISNSLEFQIGENHIILEAGDSIFVNGNILHRIRQIAGDIPEPMPNVVFSGSLLFREGSDLYQKYIQPIYNSERLPFIVFREKDVHCEKIHKIIRDIYICLQSQPLCYELRVQRLINEFFEFIISKIDTFPQIEETRIQLKNQIRIQKMLAFIYEHYKERISLADIAASADISRSEAGRCFKAYMGCSPVDALIQYRLQIAHRLLNDKSMTLEEISYSCGFNSLDYFRRQCKEKYGKTPGEFRKMGK